MKFLSTSLKILFICLIFPATAIGSVSSISDLDLSAQTFTVDTLDTNPVITGTSNGIGYTLTAVSPFFEPFSSNMEVQSYNDFPFGSRNYDDLHLGADFTIVFNQPIDYLLVALGNNSVDPDGPNFGLIPADSIDVDINGTQITILDTAGALVLYHFDSPITMLTHTDNNNLTDGWDVSFFAGTTPIPVPAAAWLFMSGIISLVWKGRKVRQSVA